MPILNTHPTPAEAYEMGTTYAALLRHLYNHPEFHYLEPPNAVIYKIDPDRTPPGLFFTTDFVQNTYIKYSLPFLPEGASRKCKELGNPWAYADPNYPWEWTWDSEAAAMKDASGNVIEFPELSSARLHEIIPDLATRNYFKRKLVIENDTDPKAKALLSGRTIDFGPDARAEVEKLNEGMP
ncbi:hypothetical protein F4808DRAFT_48834 [Astrocystis sublimbata]|nr:hypothetical protein F4808DRAFT_48834 [Astrocystis sublimbata]